MKVIVENMLIMETLVTCLEYTGIGRTIGCINPKLIKLTKNGIVDGLCRQVSRGALGFGIPHNLSLLVSASAFSGHISIAYATIVHRDNARQNLHLYHITYTFSGVTSIRYCSVKALSYFYEANNRMPTDA